MRSVTLEDFVATAPVEILDDLAELFEWAELGATHRAPPGERHLAALYGKTARALRTRQQGQISTYRDT